MTQAGDSLPKYYENDFEDKKACCMVTMMMTIHLRMLTIIIPNIFFMGHCIILTQLDKL
jgi:hypothetical protein